MLRHELTSPHLRPSPTSDNGGCSIPQDEGSATAVTIGGLRVRDGLLLAPMSGITDLPFRMINRELGCGFAFTEMVSARSLVYGNRTTRMLISSCPGDTPLGIQLLGDDVDILRRAIDIVMRTARFDVIDLNAACPVQKVTRRGEGAYLLTRPDVFSRVLTVMVRESSVPVTVKIRSGWDDTSRNAVELALRARDAGAAAVFIHGRTRTQGYGGPVDYPLISAVKRAVDIPVIASGNGFTPLLIGRMFRETGCDGVAVARGALGNPWIFHRTRAYLNGMSVPDKPSPTELADVMQRHLHLMAAHYGERTGTVRFRKFFAWYTRGIHFAKNLKALGFQASTLRDMEAAIHMVEGCTYRDSISRRDPALSAVPPMLSDDRHSYS